MGSKVDMVYVVGSVAGGYLGDVVDCSGEKFGVGAGKYGVR